MRPAALMKSCVAPLGVALLIAATVGSWEGDLRHASRCAAGAGLLGGFLWLLILLWTVSEADEVPQRLTLALSPWFFGLLLAKTLFDRPAEFTQLSHWG